jgi:5,10-methylenetetrahydromethanopterin reductase
MRVDVILDPTTSPWDVRDLGLLAEQYGISAVWNSNYPSSRDPFLNLAPLALASSKIRMGPLVVTAYELHPYKTAKALATLNELSRGRACLMLGGPTGVNAAMGMGTGRMVGRVRECAEVLKGVRPDRALNYPGKIFQVWGFRPDWATDPAPQVYIGANKPQMLRMAAKVADRVMLGDPTPAVLTRALDTLDHELTAAGRQRTDVVVSALVAWHVKPDRPASSAEARSQLALRGMLDPWYLESFLDADEVALVDAKREAFFSAYKQGSAAVPGVPDSVLDKLVDNLTLAGDPGDIDCHVERLKGFRAAGLDEVALKLHGDQADAIRLIGERVVPALA